MVEQNRPIYFLDPEIRIKMGADGFIVAGTHYGGDELRAFSTAEGLIEWLSRELGAGPIVWSLTLDVWAGVAEVSPEALLPVPDVNIDPAGYQQALTGNALFLMHRYVENELKAMQPQPPPEPKLKKEKKVKEGKRMVVTRLGLEEEEEGVTLESKGDTPRPDTGS